jgi:hypothetical protein
LTVPRRTGNDHLRWPKQLWPEAVARPQNALHVLPGGRRFLVVHDRFVYRRIEWVAFAAETLDAELAKAIEQALVGQCNAGGPRVAAQVVWQVGQRAVQIVDGGQQLPQRVYSDALALVGSLAIDAVLVVEKVRPLALQLL